MHMLMPVHTHYILHVHIRMLTQRERERGRERERDLRLRALPDTMPSFFSHRCADPRSPACTLTSGWQKMIGTVPLMQLCLANFDLIVAPGSGLPHGQALGDRRGCSGAGGDGNGEAGGEAAQRAPHHAEGGEQGAAKNDRQFLSADGKPLRFRVQPDALSRAPPAELVRALADSRCVCVCVCVCVRVCVCVCVCVCVTYR